MCIRISPCSAIRLAIEQMWSFLFPKKKALFCKVSPHSFFFIQACSSNSTHLIACCKHIFLTVTQLNRSFSKRSDNVLFYIVPRLLFFILLLSFVQMILAFLPIDFAYSITNKLKFQVTKNF